jgi:ABC-type transporter Mla MlaB component
MQEQHFLAVPAEMTIANIGQCQVILMSALRTVCEVCFDLAGLRKIDTAGIQLLLLVIREAKQRGVSINWLNKNTVLQEAEKKLGFENRLITPLGTMI